MLFKLDKKSEAVLAFLKTQRNYSYDYAEGIPDELAEYGLDESNFFSCCRALKKKGYCDDVIDRHGRVAGISLCYEALYRKEYRWINLKLFLFTSVFVPVLVSVLTSGIIALFALVYAHFSDINTNVHNDADVINETQIETNSDSPIHSVSFP